MIALLPLLFGCGAAAVEGTGTLGTGSTVTTMTTPTTSVTTGTTTTGTTTTPTGTTTTSTTTGSTSTTTPDPCLPDEAVQVLTAAAANLFGAQEARVDVTLSAPASVAIQCTLASDPDELHLVESSAAGTAHELLLAGLLAESTYDCLAAATCPESTGSALAFSVTTGSLPRDLPPVTVTYHDPTRVPSDYLLTNPADDCTWDVLYATVYDRDGNVRWNLRLPDWVGPSIEFRYHGDDTFVWGGGWGPNASARPRIVDLYAGEVYDSAAALTDWNRSDFHHDGKMLPDGRLMTLEEVDVRGSRTFQGFQTRVVDPVKGTVDVTYDSQRAVDEGHLPGDGRGDAWHANWVDLVEDDGRDTILVSLCYRYEIVAIDAATGEWLWTFGKDGDWALVDTAGNPLPDSEFSQCQHGNEKAGDRLLVYDNGWDRGRSRVTEYQLDHATMTATLLWTWTEDEWYETTLGDADWLPNGNVLVAACHAECFSSNPGDRTTVFELDPVAGAKVWELTFDNKDDMAYRAERTDACGLFANARYCDALAVRASELTAAFTR